MKSRAELEAEREKLKKELSETKLTTDMGSDVDHFDEEADEAEEMSANIGVREALKARLSEVESQLAEMEDK